MIEFLPYIAGQITQPFNLVLMFGATVIGLIFGAIPGLSGTLAVMLFMPLTYTMNAWKRSGIPHSPMGGRLFRGIYRIRTSGNTRLRFRGGNLF